MRKLGSFLLFAAVASAAVTGTVTNGTTGKPQAGATVTLYKFGQGGMEAADSAKTDAQGSFTITKDPQTPGPKMLRIEIDGVTYNKMMPPGTPTNGLAIDVYNASKQPGAARVSKHMLLFEPAGGQLTVNETILVKNEGKTTWSDPQNGTIHFFLPAGVSGSVDAKGTAPDGLPVPIPTEKTAKPGVYTAKFEIKPGETRLDLTYTLPYNTGDAYEGKIVSKDDNSYLIVPNGVTLQGEHLADLGIEPRTQAHVYGLNDTSYKITLTGAEAEPPAAAADQADSSGPQIEQIMPRVYGQTKLILALALGILALGFALLYRASGPAKETHDRGSR
jgi:5-hydroxyisourate hydrolase-like protein (transthyretin family)